MKQTYLYGAMALGLLFTSCSSDDIVNDENRVLESDQAYYVSVRISGDVLGTRAASGDGTPVEADFTDGTGTESQINNVYFVFYDNDGNVIGDVTPADDIDKDTTWETNDVTGTVEKYYKSVIKVSVMKGEKQPTQVICYLNPVSAGNLNVHLNEIQQLQLDNAVKGNNIFPMSNSVYYASTTAEKPSIAVQLTMGVNLFTSESKAEEANEAGNCADIYVERYATKLAFDASSAIQTDFVTGQRVWGADGKELDDRNTITLHFNPQYWAVNAESKKTYVIKSFREQASDGALLPDNYSFETLNGIINRDISVEANQWDWNNKDFHRSYWGMSPAYFTSKYPEVSSDLDPNHSELQKYISYNDLKNGIKGYAADVTAAKYFKETTVGRLALDSKNPAAAVASVIYVGKYSIKLNDGAPLEDTGFYTYLSGPVPGATSNADNQPYIYFENERNTVNSAVAGGESMLKRLLIQCNILYKKVGDDSYEQYALGEGSGFNTLAQVLEVSELSEAEKANYDPSSETKLKLQHNARTLRFKSIPTAAQNIYVMTYDGYKQIVQTVTDSKTQLSLTEANIALARNVGYALYYTSGHAYFNIPVKHYGWYRKGNENRYDVTTGKLLEKETLDWNKVQVGDFGMVRNHSYSITVDKITGLASGIGGDDVELVPPAFTQDYYMSYRVNILKWAVVPTQGVDL